MSQRVEAYVAALRLGALVLAAIAAATLPARAQTPRAELSGGYQFTHVPDFTFALGWAGDVSVNIGDLWGIVGEVSGAHTTSTVAVNRQSVDVGLSLLTFMGGLRAASHINPRVVPFVQVLGGVARASGGASVPGVGFNVGVSATQPALQWGGGVLLMFSRGVGVRVSGDYRAVFFEGGRENEFRVGSGVVVALGR